MRKNKSHSLSDRSATLVNFMCIVKDERLEATITHADDGVPGRLFRLSFSDGHKGVFLAVPNSADWQEEGVGGSAYAAAVGVDLRTLCTFDLKDSPFAVAATNEGVHFNVWVNRENGGHGVYYQGAYRFHLIRTSQKIWRVTPGEDYDPETNREIVEAVTYRLLTGL